MEYLETVLRYLSTATDRVSETDVREAVEQAFPGEGEQIMGTLAEKWIAQGEERGMQQGMQQGIQQGLLRGIELGLELKFGSEGLRLLPEIYRIRDVYVLQAVHEGLKTAVTPADLRQIYA